MLESPIMPHVLEAKLFQIPLRGQSRGRTVMDYEFDFYLNGTRDMWLDGEHFPIQSGNLVFRRPGQHVVSSGDYDCYILTLDFSGQEPCKNYSRNLAPTAQPLCSSPLLAHLPPVLKPAHTSDYLRLFRRMAELFAYPNSGAELSNLALQLLYLSAADALRQNEHSTPSPSRIHNLCDFLAEHYPEPITLDRLAEEAHLNKYYLARLFRKEVGVSPMEYLIRIRMDNARTLLLETDADIATISELCGYKNIPFFITCFKRRFGITPAHFRAIAPGQPEITLRS